MLTQLGNCLADRKSPRAPPPELFPLQLNSWGNVRKNKRIFSIFPRIPKSDGQFSGHREFQQMLVNKWYSHVHGLPFWQMAA
jgi:hypothetical protein